MNKVTVRINGQEYTVKGDEQEEYLRKVGKEVNHLISSVMERNHQIDMSSASVLAALNAVDKFYKKEIEIESLRRDEGSVYKQAEGLKADIRLLEEALEKMQTENSILNDKIAQFKHADEKDKLNKEREIKRLETELRLTQDSAKEYRDENENLSKMNKELKFEFPFA